MDKINIDEIRKLYIDDGLQAKEIAIKLGMKTQSIQYYLRSSGIRKRKKIDTQELAELYTSGLTAKEIGDRFGILEGSIRERFKKFNRKFKNKIRKNKIHKLNHDVFCEFTPESCYWAGFLAADGCVFPKQRKVLLELKSSDEDHIKNFCRFCGRDTNLYHRTRHRNFKYYSSSSVIITSRKIVEDLVKKFNIVANKSLVLCPPNNLPIEMCNNFVRGYFDGDGTISWRKSRNCMKFEIVSGSKDILEWINDMINICLPRIKQSKIYYRTDRCYYCLTYSGRIQSENILYWLYKDSTLDTRLQRKFERYQEYLKRGK